MLGKIIKHEWKDTYKFCCLLLIVMLIVTVLGALSVQVPILMVSEELESARNTPGMAVLGVLCVLFLILYMLVIFGISVGTLIYLGVRFYRSMYTDEGYLTHTLPVTSHELLLGKTFVAGCWYLIIIAAVVLSMVGLVASVTVTLADVTDMGVELSDALRQLDVQINLSWQDAVSAVFRLLLMILELFMGMVILFGAITLGQLSAKHKALMSVVCYVGILMARSILNSLITIPLTFSSILSGSAYSDSPLLELYTPSFWVSLLLDLAISVGLYFLSSYIVQKKLNLE